MKIKNSEVESTPFVQITITDKARNGQESAWISLYWTVRAGVYGYQVAYNGYSEVQGRLEGKTGGCGYSKPCAALQEAIAGVLGYRSYSCHYEASSLLSKYRTGGNHYQLSMRQLKAVCKAHH